MKRIILMTVIASISLHCGVRSQDSTAIVSAFFGLDNALPILANALCLGANGMDGMPVNFNYPIDGSSLSASDFEVVDGLGNSYAPMCAVLAPANENGENRTVLLIGQFGNAGTNPPVRINVIDDLFTTNTLVEESSCSEIINLNGAYTTNVVPLSEGPSLFFAQKIDGGINDCDLGNQTIQVAWDGGITPFINGVAEDDLFQFYTGYSDSSGVLIAHQPIAIADINDNDNFHQLCFSTNEEIVRISIIANTVEDPNGDPNSGSEIDVSYCSASLSAEEIPQEPTYNVYPNPFSAELFVENLRGDEYFKLYDLTGQVIFEGGNFELFDISNITSGLYFFTIRSRSYLESKKVVKK
ncbi:MAG: T9SS type A sorting domain-containing protein [Flavobacteriales bacterium]|nr:T9SS type A sorting domain-containing protein [Flavobacteriales bacterium]